MKRSLRLFALTAICLMLAPLSASAGGKFVPLPAENGKSNKLKIRFVRYTGGSTGKMVIEVRNTGKSSAKFSAKGLFFVPNGNAESAPQRLGAAGPFDDPQGQRQEKLTLKPGQKSTLKLQVFCLDSHRSSPGKSQGFSVAKKRLPKELQRGIAGGAKGILKKNKGKMSFDRSNSEIQGHVWKTRNKKWIKLQGERKSEKSSSGNRRNRIQRQMLNNSLSN